MIAAAKPGSSHVQLCMVHQVHRASLPRHRCELWQRHPDTLSSSLIPFVSLVLAFRVSDVVEPSTRTHTHSKTAGVRANSGLCTLAAMLNAPGESTASGYLGCVPLAAAAGQSLRVRTAGSRAPAPVASTSYAPAVNPLGLRQWPIGTPLHTTDCGCLGTAPAARSLPKSSSRLPEGRLSASPASRAVAGVPDKAL